MELIIVVVIVGIIAGFAIPGYQKAQERSRLKDAMLKLTTIYGAEKIYNAQKGYYWPFNALRHYIEEINSNLGINIVENGMTYYCQGNSLKSVFVCAAENASPWWRVWVRSDRPLDNNNPFCQGSCP